MDADLKIVICGVGGQGILYMARVLYEMARLSGREVMGSETHGMSQRGGSVTSHVKIGDFHSPMVRLGTADLLLVVKAEEIYPHLTFLRKGGRVALNAPETFDLAPPVAQALKERDIEIHRVDATGCAVQLGAPLAANLVLLSASLKAGCLPSRYEVLEQAINRVSPPRFKELNLAAIKAGSE
jgi:indolepyruvate ferredoxin oxidoreductase beta subunit